MELVLEQTQQGTSYEVSVSAEGVEELKRKVKIKGEKKEALLTLRQKSEHQSDTHVITVKMEILLEPTSNKLLVERFDTSAGNLVKDILLKLNLPDHRSILTDSKIYIKMVMEIPGQVRKSPWKAYPWPAILRNTIELLVGNNVVPLRSDTIRLVQNGCSFHGLRSEDPNQHLKDFLKLVESLDLDGENRERTRLHLFQFSLRDQASNWLERLPAGSITTWEDLTTRFLAQFFPSGRTIKPRNAILMFQQHHGESLSEAWTRFKDLLQKLRDHNAKESWALLEDLALYENESWNNPKEFAKPVKAITLPQDVPSTSDRRLIKLETQVQRLMEAYLAPTQPT
ncbi:MAK10-like protein [Tanacetum coccineum]